MTASHFVHVTNLDGRRYTFRADSVLRVEELQNGKTAARAFVCVDQPPRQLLVRESVEELRQQLEPTALRDDRQRAVFSWCQGTFGRQNSSTQERARRLFEEAAELAQAEGVVREDLERLLRHVYGKPRGEPAQEVGGIGVTLLAYCGAADLSAEAEERREWGRVLSKDPEHFRARHNKKADAGVARRVPERAE